MSQENIRLAYGVVDAMNERDLGAYLALMDEDVEVVSRIAAMEGGSARPRRNPALVGQLVRGIS